MSGTYTINYSDPSQPAFTILPQTTNTDTSLTMVGYRSPAYGEILWNDLLHLLEHFASPTSPPRPTIGQLWLNTSTYPGVLYYFGSDSDWHSVGGASAVGPRPINPQTGTIWYDSEVTGRGYVWTGSEWVDLSPSVIGPQGPPGPRGPQGPPGAAAAADGTVVSLPGEIAYFAANYAPSGFLKADGSNVSRTVYSELFAVIGTLYGVGNGSTTFTLPDLRGEFIRGWDDSRGKDFERLFGSNQADTFKSHSHLSPTSNGTPGSYEVSPGGIVFGYDYGAQAAPTDVTGGAETRPTNVAMLACIRYVPSYGARGIQGTAGTNGAPGPAGATGPAGTAAILASGTGWIKYSNGVITQAGQGAVTNGTGVVIYYPTTFPNGVTSVSITEWNADGWGNTTGQVACTVYGNQLINNSSFKVRGRWIVQDSAGTHVYVPSGTGISFSYFATGW